MKTNPNELIFESVAVSPQGDLVQSSNGLSKREYFAGQIISSAMFQVHYESFGYEECAEAAVKLADALIAELNKEVK